MHAAIRCLNIFFGQGDDDYPFWLLTVRLNILIFVACCLFILWRHLSSAQLRPLRAQRVEIYGVVILTVLAVSLRFLVASPNLFDFGGIPYSRLLYGYKGYFGTAQFYSLFYTWTARDIEHAIALNRIAGSLTIPLVYVLAHRLQTGSKLFPATAAFLFAVYPPHILFSASDALAVFSLFLAASAYAILAGAEPAQDRRLSRADYLGGFTGLTLLTQVRYENVVLLIPAALLLLARRHSLRLPELIPALVAAALLLAVYAHQAVTSGLSYQNPWHPWLGLDLTIEHVALNPLFAVPLLLLGTLTIALYKGLLLGALALLPWAAAFVLAVLTSEDGHGAARVYANWLIVILPLAAYGFSLLLRAPQRLANALATVALVWLGVQPLLVRDRLATQHLEILEHKIFRSLLDTVPAGVRWIIVPDDELISRQPHSTLEVYRKYEMIHATQARVGLVGLTEHLERPQQDRCAAGACVFFFGLPCLESETYPLTSAQCQALLRTQPATLIDETTVVAAPFVACSIYTGALQAQLCDPVTKPRRFAVYRIAE